MAAHIQGGVQHPPGIEHRQCGGLAVHLAGVALGQLAGLADKNPAHDQKNTLRLCEVSTT